MKRLKICFVSLTISPDSQDGSAKFIRGVFDYFRNQGHNVKLITGKWNIKLNDPDIIQIKFLLRKSFLWVPQFFFKVFKILRSQKFDIIHGNGPKGTLPLLFFNKNNFFSTIHDLGPIETKFSKIPVEKYLIKRAVNKAKYITTCSNFVRKEINYFFPKVNHNKIFNLYSAIEEKYKPYPKEALKLKERLKIKGPVILYIGRIASYKSVDNIIAAYKIAKKEITDLNLVLGGLPDFTMEKSYREWKQNYEDIHFVGFISEKEIPYYYTMGDIFITYSYASEGFGLTPIEAIACGTPVICSSILTYREILQDNAIFVPPKSPEKLSKEIINLLKDDEKRLNLIEKAQKYIQRFSWNAVGEKLERIYYKSLNK